MNLPPFHQDKTPYCRQLGYHGKKSVIVSDGKVVSHGNADWFEFTHTLRHVRDEEQRAEPDPQWESAENPPL